MVNLSVSAGNHELRLQQQERRNLQAEQDAKRRDAIALRSPEERITRFIERATPLLLDAASLEGIPHELTVMYRFDAWPEVSAIEMQINSTG